MQPGRGASTHGAKPAAEPTPTAADETAAAAAQEERTRSQALPAELTLTGPPAVPLLPGWAKHLAEDGTPYYHHESSSESSWTPPLLLPPVVLPASLHGQPHATAVSPCR